jgi:hypothetical protein
MADPEPPRGEGDGTTEWTQILEMERNVLETAQNWAGSGLRRNAVDGMDEELGHGGLEKYLAISPFTFLRRVGRRLD